MGPSIILDKSALQALSIIEFLFLEKYYFINITPVLIGEIIADLKKFPSNENKSEFEVIKLAKKINSSDSCVNCSYHLLAINSLRGNEIPMDGRALITNCETKVDCNGGEWTYIDREEECRSTQNWIRGFFSEGEKTLASEWRQFSQNINTQELRAQLRKIYPINPSVNSFKDLKAVVNEYLYDSKIQKDFVIEFSSILKIKQAGISSILDRWNAGRYSSFSQFAPYAAYCFRVITMFRFGLAHDLITTRTTNIIDMNYLYYLPFTQIFSSGDKIQSDFAKCLINENQYFIEAQCLKSDLNYISSYWNSLTTEDKERHRCEYSCYPPENENSFTSKVWKALMRPRDKENIAIQLSEEEKERLFKQLLPLLKSMK